MTIIEEERSEDADALLARARAVDGAAAAVEHPGAAPAAPGAAPTTDWNAEARQFVDFCRGTFFEMYPRLKTVWTDEKCTAVQGVLAPVLRKHNISLERIFGKWAEEIGLAFIVAPLALPSARAVREDLAELRAKEKEKDRAAPPPNKATPPPPPDRPSAAPPDTTRLHEQSRTGDDPQPTARPPVDSTLLHQQA